MSLFSRTGALRLMLASATIAAPVFAQVATAAEPAAQTASAQTARPAPTIDQRIAHLHRTLKITSDQEKPFADFAGVMRDNAARMGGLAQKRMSLPATSSALDEMQAYDDMAQAHAEDMHRLLTAFSGLYNALTPEQKKLADQSFRQFRAGRA